jgi:hypothetical protein
LWCEFDYFPFLLDAHIGDCPCTNQICIEEGCFYLWLCCSNQDLPRTIVYSLFKSYHKIYIWCFQGVPWSSWLHSQHSASEMESKFFGPQHLECWILMFWLCKFYFLGYKLKCPWAKDAGVLGDLQWSCGCCKSILFKFFVSTHFESIFIWICLSLCLSK